MTFQEKMTEVYRALVGVTLSYLLWYALLACGVWLSFYVVFRAKLRTRRVSRDEPTTAGITREIAHSLRTIAIFGVVVSAVAYAGWSDWTQFYLNVEDYGWPWFVLSIGVMVVLHDAYFYWTHRLMHHRRLYRLVHHTHHLSTSPTPWAAYAFSPAEALIQAGIGPLIAFTIPVHPAAFSLFMGWQITFNVLGHCGYEVLPKWFLGSPLGRFLNSVTHHSLHHEKFGANYSLYFNVWDRLMGTNHPQYEQRLRQIASTPDP